MMTKSIHGVLRSLTTAGFAMLLAVGCDISVDIPELEDDEEGEVDGDNGEQGEGDGEQGEGDGENEPPGDDDGAEDPGEGPCPEVDACFEDGLDPEACFELLEACRDDGGEVPGEPGPEDECETQLLDCLDAGEDPEVCDAHFFECFGEHDIDECPEEDELFACEEAWGACLDSGEDVDVCDELFSMCLDQTVDPDPGQEPPPEDPGQEPPNGDEPWPEDPNFP